MESDQIELLRDNLFAADLLLLPLPEGEPPLPEWFAPPYPALIYPPLEHRDLVEGEGLRLDLDLNHLYYGALRELAETAEEERADQLRRLIREMNPDAAVEVCLLARAWTGRDLETALLYYELVIELDSACYEAYQDAGMCRSLLARAAGEEAEEELREALALFEQAGALRPEAGLSCWSLARTLHDLGEPERSRAVLAAYLQEHPAGSDREMVERALASGFDESESWQGESDVVRALQLACGEDPAAAVALLESLSTEYPDAPEIWFGLGTAQHRQGNLVEAERCLRRAARLMPGEPFVWWELARASGSLGRWREAEQAILSAVELEPENALYHAEHARILQQLGDAAAAAEAAARAGELAPGDEEIEALRRGLA